MPTMPGAAGPPTRGSEGHVSSKIGILSGIGFYFFSASFPSPARGNRSRSVAS